MAEKLNDKDKQLVWSLDEACRKRKELGKEGEVDLAKDLKVTKVDSSKDVLVYEYEVQKSPFEKMKASSYCKVAKWLLVIICILAAAGIIGAIVALALRATTPQSYAAGLNAPCNDSLPCDPTLGQVCTNGFCNCSSSTPVPLASGCAALVDYLGECTDPLECDSSKNLVCYNGLCTCDTLTSGNTAFWSSKSQKCLTCPTASGYTLNATNLSPCYKVFPSTTTWNSANSACQSAGGSLLSASTQAKFEFMATLMTSIGNYYVIGAQGSSTSGWKWLDGTAISSTWSGWCSSNPPTTSATQCIAAVYNNGTAACIGTLADCTSATVFGYICEIA